ncbi:hypothetical protein PG994_005820 [Apiospora phragmitis]|uniref:Polyketide synthase n=1 Tax=Apiospora phragmitis TaxID=2905665 RepID=A0ABR1VDA2_9PEZI
MKHAFEFDHYQASAPSKIARASPTKDPIAICGIGIRLAGGVRNADDLDTGSIYRGLPGAEGVGYFISDDISKFDPSFFSMMETEIERCDPQQRMLLELARECLEDAGVVDWRGKSIGCYIAAYQDDWSQLQNMDTERAENGMLTGNGDWMLANRVSYEYDLRGPSLVMRTACSSSLVALHEACRALQNGDAYAAIVGGTNLLLNPHVTTLETVEGVVFPNGSSRSFDADADGFARAEVLATVFVKRLEDALRDGNPVRAVISGIGTNSDGKSEGIMKPRAEAQVNLIRKVYADTGMDPADTAFVEVVLQSPLHSPRVSLVLESHSTQLLVFSANTRWSLEKQIQLHLDHAAKNLALLPDIACTRAIHRARLPNRAFAIMRGGKVARTSPLIKAPTASSKKTVVMLFSGQGCQWAGMGKELILENPAFAQDIDTMDLALQSLSCRPMWSIKTDISAVGSEYLKLLHAEGVATEIWSKQGSCKFISSVTAGSMHDSSAFTPEYWVENLLSPVLFKSAVENYLSSTSKASMFLEIGPHSSFSGPLRQICKVQSREASYVSAQEKGADCAASFLNAVGRLYQDNVDIDFRPLYAGRRAVSGLPTYPWDHTRPSFWAESRLSREWRQRKQRPHCILGTRSTQSPDTEPLWRNHLSTRSATWLADHRVGDDIVFPFAAYAAMAGEALRQLKGAAVGAGYHLRHVVIHTALVLTESTMVEVATSMREKWLTDTEKSVWYTFTITTHNGSGWIEHCAGEAGLLERRQSITLSFEDEAFERQVPANVFYEAMSRVGLVYGPSFQVLADLRTSVRDKAAEAKLAGHCPDEVSSYAIHPTFLDAALQLLMAAKAQGLGRNIDTRWVPTLIEDLKACHGGQNFQARAVEREGNVTIEGVSNSNVAFSIRGVRLTTLSESAPAETSDKHAAAKLEWFPDFDFLDQRSLLHAPHAEPSHVKLHQEMALLCILEEVELLANLTPCQPHFARFRGWLDQQANSAMRGNVSLVENASSLVRLSSSERQNLIYSHLDVLVTGTERALAIGTKRVFDASADIFTGRCDTLDVLMQQDLLREIYDHVSFAYGPYLRTLSNSRPNLRILEVGAGTGGTTDLIMHSLADEGTLPRYSTYTFTDVSSGFFAQAQKRFSYAANMEYKVFDITKSPFDQGFAESKGYDVILAANVVHATPSLEQTLRNLRVLLNNGGRLLLTELVPGTPSVGYTFGRFPGWWLGEQDGRVDGPLVNADRWDSELRHAGFAGTDMVVYDQERPYSQMATIVFRTQSQNTPPRKHITLLCNDVESTNASSLMSFLQKSSWEVTPCSLAEVPDADTDILCCLELEGCGLNNITEQRFGLFQKLTSALRHQKVLWLSPSFSSQCHDGRSAIATGVIRTLRSERALPIFTLEVEGNAPGLVEKVVGILKKIRKADDTGKLAPDREFALRGSDICVPRYVPVKIETARSDAAAEVRSPETVGKALRLDKPGDLEAFSWHDTQIPVVIPDNHVELEVCAVGMNFVDVLLAKGVLSQETSGMPQSTSTGIPLGHEAAGIVRRVGSGVTNLAPGDRVMCIAWNSLASISITPAALTTRIPMHLSFTEAASMPLCYATALHSLIDLARLEKGQGVDVVLNSLAGELLHESWKCVARFGVMLELGKRDLVGSGRLDMHPFLQNRSYHGINMVQFLERPQRFQKLLESIASFLHLGLIRPINEILTFKAEEIGLALTRFQEGSRIGKVVVTFPPPDSTAQIKSTPQPHRISFDPGSTYLLVGGIGGLGRSIATWMAEHGARSLLFLSRSAGSSDASKALLKELGGVGCQVTFVQGSVHHLDDVRNAVKQARTPIKGVLQLAMVLKPLDFFFMSSSLVTVIDQPGQGNYIAANMFLEAFVSYRHRLGLPASVLNICPVTGVGYVAENAHAMRNIRAQGLYQVGEREFLECLEVSLLNGWPVVGPSSATERSAAPSANLSRLLMGLRSERSFSDPNNRTPWRRDRRMGYYHNERASSTVVKVDDSPLPGFLGRVGQEDGAQELQSKAGAQLMAREIGKRVNELLIRPDETVDTCATLAHMGLDSLMAVELRRWFKSQLGLNLSVLEIVGSGTLLQLARVTLAKMMDKYHGAPPQKPAN